MIAFSDRDVLERLTWPALIEAIRLVFRDGAENPLRSHYRIEGDSPGDLLLMPAWRSNRHIGIKLVTVFPGNAQVDRPVVAGLYLLLDARTGEPVAQMDASVLTMRRTAAASVLAAKFLARPDARRLAVLGTGRVSRSLAEAYCASFDIDTLVICGRSPERSAAIATELVGLARSVVAAASVDAAVDGADIVASATLAREPLITGRHLRPGRHFDLVGAYRPDMRESDDDVMRGADGIFVDTREGAFKEAGDIVQAIESGAIGRDSIRADLAELCREERPGRQRADEITVFKSVGASCEDLAAAELVYLGQILPSDGGRATPMLENLTS